jgi:hypothetical protein
MCTSHLQLLQAQSCQSSHTMTHVRDHMHTGGWQCAKTPALNIYIHTQWSCTQHKIIQIQVDSKHMTMCQSTEHTPQHQDKHHRNIPTHTEHGQAPLSQCPTQFSSNADCSAIRQSVACNSPNHSANTAPRRCQQHSTAQRSAALHTTPHTVALLSSIPHNTTQIEFTQYCQPSWQPSSACHT